MVPEIFYVPNQSGTSNTAVKIPIILIFPVFVHVYFLKNYIC